MTMPSRLSCCPRSAFSRVANAVAIVRLGCLRFDRRFVVDLYGWFVAEGADHFVAAGDDFVAVVEPFYPLDIGRPRDPRLHLSKFRLAIRNHKNALNLFLVGLLSRRVDLCCRLYSVLGRR